MRGVEGYFHLIRGASGVRSWYETGSAAKCKPQDCCVTRIDYGKAGLTAVGVRVVWLFGLLAWGVVALSLVEGASIFKVEAGKGEPEG